MKQYSKQDPESIQALFNIIAAQYDKTNAVLSFNLHKSWNRKLVEKVIVPAQPKVLLDLCCGTGAIAFNYLKQSTYPLTAFMLDFSEGMLDYAKRQVKANNLGRHDITFLKADAQQIPLTDNTVDCATIAYGIRNVKDSQKCINDVLRVLKPGGSFGILELTKPKHKLLQLGHSLYLRGVLPIIGKLMTSNKDAYKYLCNSIHGFIPPEELQRQLQKAGFLDITITPLLGGVATILSAKKPA